MLLVLTYVLLTQCQSMTIHEQLSPPFYKSLVPRLKYPVRGISRSISFVADVIRCKPPFVYLYSFLPSHQISHYNIRGHALMFSVAVNSQERCPVRAVMCLRVSQRSCREEGRQEAGGEGGEHTSSCAAVPGKSMLQFN